MIQPLEVLKRSVQGRKMIAEAEATERSSREADLEALAMIPKEEQAVLPPLVAAHNADLEKARQALQVMQERGADAERSGTALRSAIAGFDRRRADLKRKLRETAPPHLSAVADALMARRELLLMNRVDAPDGVHPGAVALQLLHLAKELTEEVVYLGDAAAAEAVARIIGEARKTTAGATPSRYDHDFVQALEAVAKP